MGILDVISFANVVMQQLISQLLRELCVHIVKDLSLQLVQSKKLVTVWDSAEV